MKNICKHCRLNFEVSPADLAFLAKISPTFAGEKFALPAPTLCSDCRQQLRLLWRNERSLYRRTCDLCEKSIISCYAPDSPAVVYCTECWWSDRWDPLDFGQDIDFSQPFFPQFLVMQRRVPRLALSAINNENSDYVHLSGSNKNCYLLFAAEFNQDCHHGTQVVKCEGCIDALDCFESRYCYEVTDVEKCHEVSFSHNCSNCSGSAFLFDCRSCMDCLFSTNLRSKRNVVRNRQVTPEEFAREMKLYLDRLDRGDLPQMIEEFRKLEQQSIHRAQDSVNCENATGDYLKNCRNVAHCYDLTYGEDCAYVLTGFQVKDLMDVCHTTDAELGYNGISLGYGAYNTICTHGSWGARNLLYCDVIQSGSSDLFGCVSIKKNQYCILNKQYSKEEYEVLAAKLCEHMIKIGEFGEFFPSGISPFAYNETNAQFYFPLNVSKAKEQGFPWREADDEVLRVSKTIPASGIPSAIGSVPDDILEWAITCEATDRPFRIVKQELQFYREHHLPIPHLHPDERHRRRMSLRNPRKLWSRKCAKCGKGIETTYSMERPEKVYCEECYLKEVY